MSDPEPQPFTDSAEAIATLRTQLSRLSPDKAAVNEAIAQLERQRQRGTAADLAGCWQLLWTGGRNGKFPARVVQCIAPEAAEFENRIEVPIGFLSVRSRCTYTPKQRLEFVAQQVSIHLGQVRFGLPLGNWAKGWLQTTYLDGEWHLERGDRGGLAVYRKIAD